MAISDGYKTVPTSREVWAVIFARHPDLVPMASYSAPGGDYLGGNTSIAKMFTSYGFKGSNYPIMEAETTWKINRDSPYVRENEEHKYWLCLPIKQEEE